MPTKIRTSKQREKRDIVLLEGLRLIQDALDAKVKLKTLLFSRLSDMQKLSLPEEGFDTYKVPYATLQLWSDLKTTPGIMGKMNMLHVLDENVDFVLHYRNLCSTEP